MRNKIAPGEDAISGEIYKSAFENFPSYITAIFNGCLIRRVLSLRRKRANRYQLQSLEKKRAKTSLNISQ